jgi:hypothetical protein
MKLFNQTSAADEIFNSMQQNELKMAFAEDSEKDAKQLQALHELNRAAELFERAGNVKCAEEVTALISAIAQKNKP